MLMGGVDNTGTSAPVVVHCATGIGRTALFIGLDTIRRQILEGTERQVDIYKCVLRMREDRRYMVQKFNLFLPLIVVSIDILFF